MEDKLDSPEVQKKDTTEGSGVILNNENESSDSESRDFVSTLVDRLCENCKKVREQILIKSKCANMLLENEEDGEEKTAGQSLLESELQIIKNLHRRTV